jgi:hypothetical protein
MTLAEINRASQLFHSIDATLDIHSKDYGTAVILSVRKVPERKDPSPNRGQEKGQAWFGRQTFYPTFPEAWSFREGKVIHRIWY